MNKYLKYSSMVFQMGATIGLFAFIGYKLDQHFKPEKPYYTIGFSLAGVGIALYMAMKDFLKPEK